MQAVGWISSAAQVAAAEAMTSQAPSIAKLALKEYHRQACAASKPEQGVEAMVLRHLIIMAEDELTALQVRQAGTCLA